MIIFGCLAGKGVYEMAEQVITYFLDSSYVAKVYVLTPFNRFRCVEFFDHPKIVHLNRWDGMDSHDKTGLNRERIRRAIKNGNHNADWVWMGDEDALPCPGYLQYLEYLKWCRPVLLTGKTFNSDGTRWYDICAFDKDQPFPVPYDDWKNPRYSRTLYCSGNQHIMNSAGFDLNVPYVDIPGEDPHYCWAFKDAGGHLEFQPAMSVTLQKKHCSLGI